MSSFTIKTATLQTMVNKVIRGASNSQFSAITSLINVVLENNVLSMTTTDSDNYLTISEQVTSAETLNFTVGVDMFSKLVTKTSTENITIKITDDMISFTGNGTYKIPIQLDVDGSPIKYPTHEINNPEETGTIKTSVIKNIILHNKPSLALTLEAPYLVGYLCNVDNVISADTFNICVNKVKTFNKCVLVRPIVFELLSMSSEEDISYKMYQNTVLFETPTMKLFAVLMDGVDDYPVDAIMSYCETEYPSSCVLPKTAILNVIDRLSLFIRDDEQNGLYMTFTDKGVKLEAMNTSAVESVSYQGSTNFKDYSCCIGVESFKKQLSARVGESVNVYYGDDSTVTIKEDTVTQIISLLDDPRVASEE